jgi:hypothetical protein
VVLITTAIAVALVSAGGAAPAFKGKNSKIVFQRGGQCAL